jgi:hypothetical protein
MTVYVFGNEDSDLDNRVYGVMEKLKKEFKKIDFVRVKPNEDIPDKKELNILDTVQGIDEPILFNEKNLDKLVITKGVSAHDYDLGFQLKYLVKLGKLKKIRVVAIPQTGELDYLRIQSIFKKLVAQDIQGS